MTILCNQDQVPGLPFRDLRSDHVVQGIVFEGYAAVKKIECRHRELGVGKFFHAFSKRPWHTACHVFITFNNREVH